MRSKSPNVDVSQSSDFKPLPLPVAISFPPSLHDSTFPGFFASRMQDLSHVFKNQKKQLGG
jgi:hypothetical protein